MNVYARRPARLLKLSFRPARAAGVHIPTGEEVGIKLVRRASVPTRPRGL